MNSSFYGLRTFFPPSLNSRPRYRVTDYGINCEQKRVYPYQNGGPNFFKNCFRDQVVSKIKIRKNICSISMFAMNHHLSSIHDRLVSRRFLISRRLRAGACVINPTLYRRGRAGRCIHFRTSRFNNGRVCVISGWVVAANRVRCGCCMQRRKG